MDPDGIAKMTMLDTVGSPGTGQIGEDDFDILNLDLFSWFLIGFPMYGVFTYIYCTNQANVGA